MIQSPVRSTCDDTTPKNSSINNGLWYLEVIRSSWKKHVSSCVGKIWWLTSLPRIPASLFIPKSFFDSLTSYLPLTQLQKIAALLNGLAHPNNYESTTKTSCNNAFLGWIWCWSYKYIVYCSIYRFLRVVKLPARHLTIKFNTIS
jgi:hypothetical protein